MNSVLQPSLEQVQSMAADYDKIPLSFEILADYITPMQLANKLRISAQKFFFLESVEGGEKWARYSFLGFDPSKILRVKAGKATLQEGDKVTSFTSSSLDAVRKLTFSGRVARFDNLPPFTGGAVGYFGYETVRYTEDMNLTSEDVTGLDDCVMMFFDTVIAFDHLRQKLNIILNMDTTGDIAATYAAMQERAQAIADIIHKEVPIPAEPGYAPPEFISNCTKESYMRGVERAREYIRNGDIFQLVPSQRFTAKMEASLWSTYRMLRVINPSPYMYYLKIDDMEITGASPETLVKVQDREITTFPIAGTRPRGATQKQDKALETELLADPKELSEHNMLVDLARNDVGRVAEFDTVQVKDYMKVNRYSHVMHITSQVSGTLRSDLDSMDALASVLPAGTLSGAPKIRAMEIIDELEEEQRGLYGGGLGYVGFDGNLDTCIVIRTVVKKGDKVYLQAGGGVVLDSDPETEYQESINKLMALFRAVEEGGKL